MSLADAGPGPAGPASRRPEDELLSQIRLLLDQYLSMGSHTPVAPEAQQLADAIDQATGGGGSTAASDMGATSGQDYGGGGPGPDMMAAQPGEPPKNTGHKTFGDANKSAADRLKKRNAKK
jgi:hypothetical protein